MLSTYQKALQVIFMTVQPEYKQGNKPHDGVHTEPRRPETHNPDISGPLSDFVMRCIAKESENRFPDVNAALEELKVLLT